MSNFHSVWRTNMFEVTDEIAYNKLVTLMKDNGYVDDEFTNFDMKHGMAGSTDFDLEEIDEDILYYLSEISHLLPEGEVLISIEAWNSGFDAVGSVIRIFTKDDYYVVTAEELALAKAREILGNKKYPTSLYN